MSLYSISQIWDDPADHAISDRIAGAVALVLGANAKLDSWTEGRIRMIAGFDPTEKSNVPDISVSPLDLDEEFLPSQVSEESVTIGIQVRWLLGANKVSPGTPTEATVIEEIKKALELNQVLKGTTLSASALADRYLGIQSVQFLPIDDGGSKVMFSQLFRATWEVERIRTLG